MVLRLDGLQPIRLLILVRLVELRRCSNQILLILANSRDISTTIHLEQQRYVHLFLTLCDLVLCIVRPNNTQIRDLADHILQVLGQPLQIYGRRVGLTLRELDHAFIIQLLLDLILYILSNLLVP